jgi:hypothetical protein
MRGSTEILIQRELINAGSDKRFARRDEKGQFKESDDQGSSLSRDPRQHATINERIGIASMKPDFDSEGRVQAQAEPARDWGRRAR